MNATHAPSAPRSSVSGTTAAAGKLSAAARGWRIRAFWVTIIFLVPALSFYCITVGPYAIESHTLWRVLGSIFHAAPSALSEKETATAHYIVVHLRLARVALALLVGAALALSGTVYQGILLNPLADPFTLGVSTGAAFGASVTILMGWASWKLAGISLLPVVAFLGAVGALSLVMLLGRLHGTMHPTTLVLAGIIVSTFLSAWISLLKSLHEESLSAIVFWIMGSLSGRSWRHVLAIVPYVVAGFWIIMTHAREMDLLALGDTAAFQTGVDTHAVRRRLLGAASLVAAAAVAVSGVVGFIGLVVPHVARLCLGPRHRQLLPASMMLGAVLTLVSDTLARTLLPDGREIPLGVVTAILGAPFFAYLLIHKKRTVVL
ncbi:FecCD family ABC transporter permease [Desulfosoma caldarium]|uniref:Iron complex transport system permease protein n=1 Tax=Desulfosoma caldarium TaxID=610254 RepID=A0A3N1VQ35_9BACT|nr:iron ABC transporter permease [Desulfosoma caldarium]ROR03181.1 iron complex transport system permease protein [Desulfosoma caldarium]